MDDTEQMKLYKEAMGSEALERQRVLAKERWSCCGTKKPNHAPLCVLRRSKG